MESSAHPWVACRATSTASSKASINVGVELGQLAFVVLVSLSYRSLEVLQFRWPRWAELVPGYAIGSLGAFWFIQRTVLMF